VRRETPFHGDDYFIARSEIRLFKFANHKPEWRRQCLP
jgi:hypothetical protein